MGKGYTSAFPLHAALVCFLDAPVHEKEEGKETAVLQPPPVPILNNLCQKDYQIQWWGTGWGGPWEWEREVVYAYFSFMKHTKSQQGAPEIKPVTLSVPPRSAFGKVACYAYGMKNYIQEKQRK